jgi:branched-chain amino acid transport system permease protein
LDPIVFYIATLAVYFCIYNILTWGLNIQFGYTGILDFTYIIFMAAGAYITGVVMLGPSDPTVTGERYILGLGLAFPLALVVGAAGAGVLGLLVGLIALRRLRSDFLGIVTISVGTIAYDLVGGIKPLFNGQDGIFSVPQWSPTQLGLDPTAFPLFFLVVAAVVMAGLWVVANRIYNSPLGRTMRAIREDVDVAESFGKDTYKVRMMAMVVGCVYAGVAGGLLVAYISAFNPSSWTLSETFAIWAAMLIGGRANNWGAVVGALLVPIVFTEATRFLPSIPGHPVLILDVRNILIGVLLIAVLRLMPRGILPERRKRFALPEHFESSEAAAP